MASVTKASLDLRRFRFLTKLNQHCVAKFKFKRGSPKKWAQVNAPASIFGDYFSGCRKQYQIWGFEAQW